MTNHLATLWSGALRYGLGRTSAYPNSFRAALDGALSERGFAIRPDAPTLMLMLRDVEIGLRRQENWDVVRASDLDPAPLSCGPLGWPCDVDEWRAVRTMLAAALEVDHG